MNLITISVNGTPHDIATGATLADFVASIEPLPPALATAVNGEFVAKGARATHALREGDAVFTFQPITGG